MHSIHLRILFFSKLHINIFIIFHLINKIFNIWNILLNLRHIISPLLKWIFIFGFLFILLLLNFN